MAEHAWYALVEENAMMSGWTRGDAYTWRLTQMIPLPPGSSVADLARDVAIRFVSDRPAMPQRRSVFRINELTYLVRVEGATSTHHFRVTVAEHVAEFDGEGRPVTPGYGSSIEA